MSKRSAKKHIETRPIQCVWGLLCSMSLIDQQRNNISLFNVIDQWNLPADIFKLENAKRGVPFEHEIVALWRRTMNTEIDDRRLTFDVGVSLFDPNGTALQRIVAPLIFEPKIRRMRFRVQINGLRLSQPGDYFYRLEAFDPGNDTREYFDIPFEVKLKISGT